MSADNYGVEYQEAVDGINKRLMQIQALYEECEDIAIQFNIAFEYSGPARTGDGGYFCPQAEEHWGEIVHWIASSNSC